MKLNIQLFGGRGASSSTSKAKIEYSYSASFIGENLNESQQKEIQDKATKYINSLNLKNGNIRIVAESYAYQNQIDEIILPGTKPGTKGGTIQEAKYQERARIDITNTNEEEKLLKNGFKKYQFGNYISYEKIIYGKKIS